MIAVESNDIFITRDYFVSRRPEDNEVSESTSIRNNENVRPFGGNYVNTPFFECDL